MMSLKIIFSFSKKTQLHVHCNQTLIYNFNYYQNLNTLHFFLFLIDTQISKNKTKITQITVKCLLTWRKHIFHTSPLGLALRPPVHDQTAVPFPQRMYTCWSGLTPV